MLIKGTKFDHFVIEGLISESGGMSEVYLVRNAVSNHRMAIKIANTEISSSSHEDMLLQWESDLLKQWDWRHNGIVRLIPIPLKNRRPEYAIRAVGLPNQPWYMVMEYLRGESLEKNLFKIQKYPLQWRLELFYNLLLILSFIHQKGYAHRDIKPGNIVFRTPISPNKYPEPVFVDFALTTNGKEQRAIIDNSYTLEYASPERILRTMGTSDDNLSPENIQASDIWSLGVVLYEMLTGKLLFKGNKDKIRTTIIREQIQLDETLFSVENGHKLASFIRPMLYMDPEKRPKVKELIYALEEKFFPPRIVVD